jgi:hypothetical protein
VCCPWRLWPPYALPQSSKSLCWIWNAILAGPGFNIKTRDQNCVQENPKKFLLSQVESSRKRAVAQVSSCQLCSGGEGVKGAFCRETWTSHGIEASIPSHTGVGWKGHLQFLHRPQSTAQHPMHAFTWRKTPSSSSGECLMKNSWGMADGNSSKDACVCVC